MAIWSFIDERRVLETLLKNKNSINTNTVQKLIVYIKHLKEIKKTKVEIRNELDVLMADKYIGFVMADWDSILRSLVNKYTKKENKEFKTLEDINIRQDELEFINKFQELELEKLLFVMLVIGKASASKTKSNKEGYWINCNSKDLFVLSKFKFKSKVDRFDQREYKLYDIREKGLIEVQNICDSTGMKLMYGKSEKDESGLNITIKEDNIDSLVFNYLRWRGEKIVECRECGKLVESNAKKPTIYCKTCSIKIDNAKRGLRRK